jgi:hypothetical protein
MNRDAGWLHPVSLVALHTDLPHRSKDSSQSADAIEIWSNQFRPNLISGERTCAT